MTAPRRCAAAIAMLLALPASVDAQQLDPAELAVRVGIDQKLGASLPADLAFVDEHGASTALGAYFGERPLILALVYYECPMLCGVVMEGLISNLRVVGLEVGVDFDVLTVSIDPGETADVAIKKKNDYLSRYGRLDPVTRAGWHALTGGQEAIERLADTVGFRYVYDPHLDEYAHGAAVIAVSPEGRISRYFYGVEYAARDLRLGLIEAADNTIGTLVDQVYLLCYAYDPVRGKYGFAIWGALRVAGVATVLALLGFIIVSVRRERLDALAVGHGGTDERH